MIPVIEKISVPEKVSVLVKNNVVTFSCSGTETQVKIPYPFEVSLSDVDFISDYHASSEYRKRAVTELVYHSFIEALSEIGELHNEN